MDTPAATKYKNHSFPVEIISHAMAVLLPALSQFLAVGERIYHLL
jgi:hypothetical protein